MRAPRALSGYAVGPVCDAAPGILIDDARPYYRLAGAEDAAAAPAPAAAAAADCIAVNGDPLVPSPAVDDELLTALASGKRVVSLAADSLSTARLQEACRQGGTAIAMVARELYGADEACLRVERSLRRIAGDQAGVLVAVCITHRGYLGDRRFFTSEAWRYVGAEHAYREELPRGGARGPTTYTIHIEGDPADLESHW